MTNLDETQQEEKRKIVIPPVRQSEGGENKNQLAALLSADDEPTCQNSSDGGNMTHLSTIRLWLFCYYMCRCVRKCQHAGSVVFSQRLIEK